MKTINVSIEVDNAGEAQDALREVIGALNQGYLIGTGWSLDDDEEAPFETTEPTAEYNQMSPEAFKTQDEVKDAVTPIIIRDEDES